MDYYYFAPDNGVLSAVFAETPPKKVVELTERKYARPTVSRTFEGRDRFAPAAGHLAKGVSLVSLGKYSTVGNLMGNLMGTVMIEGFIARLVYLSLYKMHQMALFGPFRMVLIMLSSFFRSRIHPKIKLH